MRRKLTYMRTYMHRNIDLSRARTGRHMLYTYRRARSSRTPGAPCGGTSRRCCCAVWRRPRRRQPAATTSTADSWCDSYRSIYRNVRRLRVADIGCAPGDVLIVCVRFECVREARFALCRVAPRSTEFDATWLHAWLECVCWLSSSEFLRRWANGRLGVWVGAGVVVVWRRWQLSVCLL